MNCIDARRKIDAWLDGELSGRNESELRRHLETCPACARHERGLRSVADEAAGLPESIEPPRDLWRRIEGRIDGGDAADPRPPAAGGEWRLWLVAASLFVVTLATAIVVLREARDPQVGRPPNTTKQTQTPAPVAPAVGIGAAEEAFRRASRDLRAVLAERRASYSPETAAAIDRNLALTDDAIEAITAELRKDPASHELNRLLRAQYQRQLNLLQRVTERAARL